MFVSFTDKSMKIIEGVFTDPQNESEYPYQAEITEDDERYVAYIAATTISVLQRNGMTRDELLQIAALRIAPLQDAVDLDEATDEEKKSLTAWKKYRISLNRLDLVPNDVVWPETPR